MWKVYYFMEHYFASLTLQHVCFYLNDFLQAGGSLAGRTRVKSLIVSSFTKLFNLQFAFSRSLCLRFLPLRFSLYLTFPAA